MSMPTALLLLCALGAIRAAREADSQLVLGLDAAVAASPTPTSSLAQKEASHGEWVLDGVVLSAGGDSGATLRRTKDSPYKNNAHARWTSPVQEVAFQLPTSTQNSVRVELHDGMNPAFALALLGFEERRDGNRDGVVVESMSGMFNAYGSLRLKSVHTNDNEMSIQVNSEGHPELFRGGLHLGTWLKTASHGWYVKIWFSSVNASIKNVRIGDRLSHIPAHAASGFAPHLARREEAHGEWIFVGVEVSQNGQTMLTKTEFLKGWNAYARWTSPVREVAFQLPHGDARVEFHDTVASAKGLDYFLDDQTGWMRRKDGVVGLLLTSGLLYTSGDLRLSSIDPNDKEILIRVNSRGCPELFIGGQPLGAWKTTSSEWYVKVLFYKHDDRINHVHVGTAGDV